MKTSKIFFNSSERMNKIQSNSVRLMVTSPPYWDLKDYEADNQIGFKENYETYIKRLNSVWKETARVVQDDGVIIININTKSDKKSLKLLPFDFIKQMEVLNFHLMDVHYWHKSSAIPQLRNFGDHFEYFLIFARNKKFLRNKVDFFDYKCKESSQTNIWNINKKFGSIGKKYMVHPAVFPLEYIKRLIKIFSNEGDTVLDPFLGSGTSLIAAIQLERKFYGFELNNSEYKKIIYDQLNEFKLDINQVEFCE